MENSYRKGKAFLLIGSLFVLIGVTCNEWVLASLFSADGAIMLSRRIVIWIFDFSMITVGIAIIMKRKSINMRLLYNYFLMAFIMVFSVEVVLNIAHIIIHSGYTEQGVDTGYLLPPFKDKEWAKTLFKERREIPIVYKPFKMWGHEEYHGRYINLDSQGYRKTWNPSNFQEEKPKTIYIFGGSTTWSLGARDDYTMPSFVSKKLNEKGYNFMVHNYAEFAYINAQEIISLILLLRDGHRPDYVIFYDGANDVYTSYQSGEPGHLSNWFSLSERLKKTKMSNTGHLLAVFENLIGKYSMIYRELSKIGTKINPPEVHFQEVAHSFNDDELRKLSEDFVEYYTKSFELLDNLSKIYGFKYLCFWQPVVFTEEKLTDEESNIDVRLQDESLGKLFIYSRDSLKTKSLPHFYDITDVFRGRTKTYYWDWAHLTEDGNEVVADKIVSIFEKEYLLNE